MGKLEWVVEIQSKIELLDKEQDLIRKKMQELSNDEKVQQYLKLDKKYNRLSRMIYDLVDDLPK